MNDWVQCLSSAQWRQCGLGERIGTGRAPIRTRTRERSPGERLIFEGSEDFPKENLGGVVK